MLPAHRKQPVKSNIKTFLIKTSLFIKKYAISIPESTH